MTSNPFEYWRRVAPLVDGALEREPDDRARYLGEACPGDAALQAEVAALLAHAQAPSFLDSGAVAFAAPLLASAELRGANRAPAGSLMRTTEMLRTLAREHAASIAGAGPPNDIPVAPGLPYELERKLGRGGMATVYLAHDAKHDRRVAVKVLDAQLTVCVEAQRFVQEIRLTARLQHPHVLGLLDSGVFGPEAGALAGRPYYVMPYVEGESLRDRLTRRGSLGVGEAVRLLREVADALSYAHEQGVVHRDIKPENILLSREHAVVADFGIAKALFASQTKEAVSGTASVTTNEALTELGTFVGTPAYMAPEQAAVGAQVDHRADVYAWGVVAYELLAGRHPFGGRAKAQEFVVAHTGKIPRSLWEIAPAVPLAIATLVMRCLAKSPAERPTSGADIVAALDAVVPARVPPVPLGGAPSRRVRHGTAVLGVALLLGVVGTSAHWRNRQGAPHQGVATDGSTTARPRGAARVADTTIQVVGSGDPAVDVRAVQAAVDHGGDVVLKGHFSFSTPPRQSIVPLLASGWYPPAAEVLVSHAITISGTRDAHGTMTTIEAGTIPFYVDAVGQQVTIRGLRFVRPISDAILVHAVRGLEIASSKIEGIVPYAGGGEGIAINTRGEMPLPASPGDPQSVSGHLLIAHNDIDGVGGTTHDATTGVMVFSVGQSPNGEVDLDIIGNTIRNTTGSTINIRRVNGRVRVLGNTLRTSREVYVGDNDAVRLVNAGSYLMANNTVECKWANAAGIAVFSPFAEWPMEHAIVEDNDVLMSPSPGAELGDISAGISIKGFAHGVVVRNNRIRGHAGAALAMYAFRGGVPADNAFINNRLDHFEAALADIFVGSGVQRARIVGPGSVLDRGARAMP